MHTKNLIGFFACAVVLGAITVPQCNAPKETDKPLTAAKQIVEG